MKPPGSAKALIPGIFDHEEAENSARPPQPGPRGARRPTEREHQGSSRICPLVARGLARDDEADAVLVTLRQGRFGGAPDVGQVDPRDCAAATVVESERTRRTRASTRGTRKSFAWGPHRTGVGGGRFNGFAVFCRSGPLGRPEQSLEYVRGIVREARELVRHDERYVPGSVPIPGSD